MTQHTSGPLSSRLPWKRAAAVAAGGLPVGILWWLLAPGGLNLITRDPKFASGANPELWLPRDLTLGGLFVFAGCLVAVFLNGSGGRAAQSTFLICLAGGLAGALVAWQTGMLAAQLWGSAADTSVSPSVAFSLRSLPVLLLWPGATAISVFVLSLLSLLRQGPGGTGALAGEACPARKMDR